MRPLITRRFATVLAAGLLALVGVAPTAGAEPGSSLSAVASGPFTGTQSFTFGTDGCSFVHQVFDGTYWSDKRQAGSFHIDGCVESAASLFPYNATFELEGKGTATLTGAVSGTIGPATGSTYPLNFLLVVTGGTGRFAHASGSIALNGVWHAGAMVGPIDGDIVASLTRN